MTNDREARSGLPPSLPSAVLGAAAIALFLVWSNSFVAIGFLLGSEEAAARFDWIGLTVARFLPAAITAGVYCFVWRRRESIEVLRRFPGRLTLCGLLAVPCYNLTLFYGQQYGVPAPIASLTTALLPLFVLVLSRVFLGETITRRQVAGFAIALVGMLTIATASRTGLSDGQPSAERALGALIAITALAPLSWSIFSILSKPVMTTVSPVVWTFLSIVVGTVPVAFVAPWRGGKEMLHLDATGWAAVLFLSIVCSVVGYAVWTWLLQHLEASTVGLTVFLNPPLTTLSKLALQLLFPATFVFVVGARDLLGGATVLLGLAVALGGRRAL